MGNTSGNDTVYLPATTTTPPISNHKKSPSPPQDVQPHEYKHAVNPNTSKANTDVELEVEVKIDSHRSPALPTQLNLEQDTTTIDSEIDHEHEHDAHTVMVNPYSAERTELSVELDLLAADSEIQENEEAIAPLSIDMPGIGISHHVNLHTAESKYHEEDESIRNNPSITMDKSTKKIRIRNQSVFIGDTLWILSNATGVWRECIVRDIDTEKSAIEIHYISYSSFFDEWINTNSNRIALQRPGGDRLRVHDNISVYVSELHAWIEAEVTAINETQDLVQVMLVSPGKTMPKQWLPRSSPLLSVRHKRVNDVPPMQNSHSTPL